jgi:hypothetical protein
VALFRAEDVLQGRKPEAAIRPPNRTGESSPAQAAIRRGEGSHRAATDRPQIWPILAPPADNNSPHASSGSSVAGMISLWEVLLNHFKHVARLAAHDRSDRVHGHAIGRLWRDERRHDEFHWSNLDVQ